MPAPFVFFRAHLMVYAITMEGVPLCLTVWALKHLLVHVFGEGAITRILLAVVVFGCLDRQVFSSVNLPEIRRFVVRLPHFEANAQYSLFFI